MTGSCNSGTKCRVGTGKDPLIALQWPTLVSSRSQATHTLLLCLEVGWAILKILKVYVRTESKVSVVEG